MITPDYLDNIVKQTEHRVAALNDALVKRIADRIAALYEYNGEVALIPSSIADMHKLMNIGATLQDIQQEIQRQLPDIQQEVQQAFLNAANEIGQSQTEYAQTISTWLNGQGYSIDVPNYAEVGITNQASQYGLTPYEIRRLQAAYDRTNGTIYNLTQSTANAAQLEYMESCDEAFFEIQHGVSPSRAIISAIDRLASRGIRDIAFGAAYRQSIETCVSRAVRTGINQANAEICLTRCAEMGVDYVLVSEHYGARVTNTHDYRDHSWWQGQVYKLNWRSNTLAGFAGAAANTPGFEFLAQIQEALAERDPYNYPDFDETCGYGDILGICGINCRHTFSNFYPGIQEEPEQTVDPELNEEYYRRSQQARAMERDIRQYNRRINALKGIPGADAKEERRRLRGDLAAKDEKYREFCREHNISDQNFRIHAGR